MNLKESLGKFGLSQAVNFVYRNRCFESMLGQNRIKIPANP